MTKSDLAPAWIYDGSPLPDPHGFGERAVAFIRRLTHPKSGKNIQLDPWMERIIRRVYGDTLPDGSRRVRRVYLRVGRGNRKTTLAGALVCLHLFGPEHQVDGQIVSAADSQEQATHTYGEVAGYVSMSGALSRAVSVGGRPHYAVRHVNSGSVFKSLTADGGKQHGRTPNLSIVDELHAWTSDALFTALRTAMPKVPNSLLVITTTAGAGMDGLAWDTERYAREVATGRIADESFLPIIFSIEDEDAWDDETVWPKANPGLLCSPAYPDVSEFRSYVTEGRFLPARRAEFEQYSLGRWQDSSLSEWLDMAIYDQAASAFERKALEGKPCWIGVDYGAVYDLTAIVAAFPDGQGCKILAWFFLPEADLARKQEADDVPYLRWKAEGHLATTPGNIVDRSAIASHIRLLCERFDVQEVAYDPYKLREIMADLAAEGIPCVEFRQGWATMGPAIETLQACILSGRFHHGGHPILRRHFADVVTRIDPAGNASFHKGKSKGRIDGAVASAMAVARASAGSRAEPSIYASPTFKVEDVLF